MSKLGVHFQGTPERKDDPDDVTTIVRNSQIEIVKGINVDHWPEPNLFPDQRVFARLWIGGDDKEHAYMDRGAEGAKEYFEMLKPRYQKLLRWGVRDVEGPNEPHPQTKEQYNVYENFEREWALQCVDIGLCPWVWSWGVGWPPENRNLWKRSVKVAVAGGGGLAVHEYGAPSVMSGDGWWTLRYKKTCENLGIGFPKNSVAITECGIDGGVIDWSQPPWNDKRQRRGWKDWSESWMYPPIGDLGQGLLTPRRYFLQLREYDKALMGDDKVLCATPFVTIPNSDWADFDVGSDILRMIADAHEQTEQPVTDDRIRQACYEALDMPVAHNTQTAFYRHASERFLGAPQTPEVSVGDFVAQGYPLIILKARKGQWDKIEEVSWQ